LGSGGCSAPYEVILYKRNHGSTDLRPSGDPVSTDGSGRWAVAVRSKKNADWMAEVRSTPRCDGEMSGSEDVLVRAGVMTEPVSCTQGDFTVNGAVRPNHGGSQVKVERFTRKHWRKLDTDRLNGESRYRLSGGSCSGRYRVVWEKQGPENLRGQDIFRL
jgi:hypothetical protein